MNQSQKLNLFVGLGCKPMSDVILRYKPETKGKSIKNDLLSGEPVVNKYSPKMMCIEAIPERLTVDDIEANINKIAIKGNHIDFWDGVLI